MCCAQLSTLYSIIDSQTTGRHRRRESPAISIRRVENRPDIEDIEDATHSPGPGVILYSAT
jgi:hypothetical protein